MLFLGPYSIAWHIVVVRWLHLIDEWIKAIFRFEIKTWIDYIAFFLKKYLYQKTKDWIINVF